jgi:hypothetical protein
VILYCNGSHTTAGCGVVHTCASFSICSQQHAQNMGVACPVTHCVYSVCPTCRVAPSSPSASLSLSAWERGPH